MKFKKTTLKNGLRIITVPMKGNPAVTVMAMVETGSKYETKDINGLSHFLEHMMFKGTPKRPTAKSISVELDSLGASYNAFTSTEYTGYYAKVENRHLDKALDIISDLYLNPLFKQEEIEKEKGVIIEEIKMYNDLPQSQVNEVFNNLLYGDVPAGWPVIGPEENIRKFKREDFLEYRKNHYVAESSIVVVSGDIKEKEVVNKVEKLFKNIPTTKNQEKLPVKETQDKPQVKIKYKDTSQTHLILGFRSFDVKDKRGPIMSVLNTILGQGMSSRLFTKMRDDLGICYYVRSSHDTFTDHGYLAISAGVDNTRVKIAIENIMIELNRLKTELVSKQELKKAKDFISGGIALGLETSDSRADYVGFQELLKGDIKTPEEKLRQINKVTPKQIKDLANEILLEKVLNLAMIGPFKDEKEFLPLLKFNNK